MDSSFKVHIRNRFTLLTIILLWLLSELGRFLFIFCTMQE